MVGVAAVQEAKAVAEGEEVEAALDVWVGWVVAEVRKRAFEEEKGEVDGAVVEARVTEAAQAVATMVVVWQAGVGRVVPLEEMGADGVHQQV